MAEALQYMQRYQLKALIRFISDTIDEVTRKSVSDAGLTAEEYEKRESKRIRLQYSLKECIYGSRPDKQFVKDFIYDLLERIYGLDEDNINNVISFDKEENLSVQDKFDILLYMYHKNSGKRALDEIIQKYRLDEMKQVDNMLCFCITPEDINNIWQRETPSLSFHDKMNIVVQRVYSLYKGYNCVDDILDMQIDGVSGGVNGLPETFVYDNSKDYEYYLDQLNEKKIPRSYESVWLFYRGKSIHLRFLSFNSYDELKRICENIYKFGSPGQLSQATGFKVNKLKDGSRVVVLRPEFCENWVFFVRKFDLPDVSLNWLIKGKGSEIAREFLVYLVKGCRNIAITGQQGTGKTTLLNALIEHIYSVYTLRILEMAFELHVRARFPLRNIVTVQETDTITGQDGLDIFKKTDGTVTIVGEVASDPVAAYMIQTAQVASLFTIFSHHAKTFKELVMSLRNSLLKTGIFQNENIAEEQVVRTLHFDIHLKKSITGKRYIERITECIPLKEEDYPADFRYTSDPLEMQKAFYETQFTFFRKMTGRKLYTWRDIIIFDETKDEYIPLHMPTEAAISEMKACMLPSDRKTLEDFMDKHFNFKEDRP